MQQNNWKQYKLKDLIEINSSSVSKKDNMSCILYLDTGSMTAGKIEELIEVSYNKAPSRAKRKVKDNSIVYSMVRPNQLHYGLIKNPPINMVVSTGFAVLDCCEEKADSKFIYYWLTQSQITNLLQAIAENSTSAYPAIRPEDLGNLELFLPPLEEQKRIAEILGSLDDKIELLQKQNKTLEDMAKALFKSWFVDFDVVRAKQKGLPKADIVREYHLTEELYDLFPSSFADSPLGPIPSGWEVVKISDVARVVGGGTPSTKQTKFFSASGTAIAWLTPKDLSGYQYKYIDHGQTDITQEGLTHSSAQLMPTNSIVFSSRAPIGYIAISLGEIATNQGFKSLVPLERHWTEFLYQYLCYNRYIIEGLGTGSTFKEVSGSVMKNISLCFPSSEILKAFEQETEIINSKQKIIMKEIQTLTELRDTLLPRLISGKIRV